LHRRPQRHGISRLLEVGGDKLAKKRFKRYPIAYFHIDLVEVRTAEGKQSPGRRNRLDVEIRASAAAEEGRQDGDGAVTARSAGGAALKEATVKRFHCDDHGQRRDISRI